MNTLISICIPTYQRPGLVQEAVESCLRQTYSDIEIIISDDSPDQLTKEAIESFNQPGKIRYYRNSFPLKQAANVNRLFDLALGDRLLLLHDDDLLLPDAVATLAQCWNFDPSLTAVFGKQYLIDMAGTVLPEQSEGLNARYYRTAEFAGQPDSSLWSALVAQFPNDGYLIDTKAAQQIRYREQAGDACDYDFSLRLAAQYCNFFFLDQYTVKYRLTNSSVSQGNNYTNLTYQIIRSLVLPEPLEPFRQAMLSRYASPAINRWLEVGNKRAALDIFTSQSYSWSQRFSKTGLVQGLLLACPETWSTEIFKRIKQFRDHTKTHLEPS